MIKIFKRRYLVVFVALLCFGGGLFLTGCSEDDTDDIIPDVVVSASSLDFGSIEVGSSAFQVVTIRNLTNDNIIVERVTATNPAFRVGGYASSTEFINLEVPFTIEENGARALYIGFYPEAAQEYTGQIVIESTNEDNSDRETELIDVNGTGL